MAVVLDVQVESNDCPLTAALSVKLVYRLDQALSQGKWVFEFVADATYRKQIVPLSAIERKDLLPGDHTVQLDLPSLPLDHLPASALHNVAIIRCQLQDVATNTILLEVPLVTHVNVDEDALTTAHTRRIFWHPQSM